MTTCRGSVEALMGRSSSDSRLSARTDIQHFLPCPLRSAIAGEGAGRGSGGGQGHGPTAVYDCRVAHVPETSRFSPDDPDALGDAPGRVANIVAAAERAAA